MRGSLILTVPFCLGLSTRDHILQTSRKVLATYFLIPVDIFVYFCLKNGGRLYGRVL